MLKHELVDVTAKRSMVHVLIAVLALFTAGCRFATLGHVTVRGAPASGESFGGVRVERDGALLTAEPEMALEKGDIIETGPDTTAVLEFASGRALFMPSTRAQIANPRIIEWFGEVFGFGPFTIQDEHVTAGASGTAYSMLSRDGTTVVVVLSGNVAVYSRTSAWPARTLGPGDRLTLAAGQTPVFDRLTRQEINQRLSGYGPLLGYPVMINVTGLARADAEQALRGAGIVLARVDERAVLDAARVGVVLEQWPDAGDRAQPAVLTAGVQGASMPDVTGRTEKDARAVLAQFARLTVEKRFTGRSPAGTVLAQQPRAGSTVTGGEPVRLVVEDEPAVVPSLVELDRSRALEALSAARLEVGRETTRPDTAPPGTVLEQDPKPNALATPGSKVNIVIAERESPRPVLADLAIGSAVLPQAGSDPSGVPIVWPDRTFEASVVVENRSATAVDHAFEVTVNLVVGTKVGAQLGRQSVPRLAGRAERRVTFQLLVPDECIERCFLRFAVNGSREIPEAKFEDNATSTPIIVRVGLE